jgi:hypothetical protein
METNQILAIIALSCFVLAALISVIRKSDRESWICAGYTLVLISGFFFMLFLIQTAIGG